MDNETLQLNNEMLVFNTDHLNHVLLPSSRIKIPCCFDNGQPIRGLGLLCRKAKKTT